MRSYLYKDGKDVFLGRLAAFLSLIIVGLIILWRYDSYYPLRKTEDGKRRKVVEYVFYLGEETQNLRLGRFCYYFWLPFNSVFEENTLLEVVGEYSMDSANEKFEEKRLVITEINEVSFSLTSAGHLRAVIFAFSGRQQRFLAGKLMTFAGKYMDHMHAELLMRMLLGNVTNIINTTETGVSNVVVISREQTLELKDLMRQSGLSHVLSVSGFHVNLVFALLERILMFIIICPINLYSIITRSSRKNQKTMMTKSQLMTTKELPNMVKKINVVVLMLFLVWYALLVGTAASIVRATMMMIFKLVDRYFIKVNIDGIFVLFLVSLIMMVFNPFFIYSVSFLLSFSATAGVLMAARSLRTIKTRKSVGLLSGFFMSLIVVLVIAPVLLYFFGEVNLASLVSNIVLVPLVAPMMLGLIIIYPLSLWKEIPFLTDLLWQPAINLYNVLYRFFFFGLERWNGTQWTIEIAQNRLQTWQVVVYYCAILIIMVSWQPVINHWRAHQREKQ